MKKRVLAVILSLTMVANISVPAMAQNIDSAQQEEISTVDQGDDSDTQDDFYAEKSAIQKMLKEKEEIVARSNESNGILYTVNADGETCTITDCNRGGTGTLVVPDTVDGYKVTIIGQGAFAGSQYKSIQLPENLVEIRYAAFAESAIEEIEIPDSVATIYSSAFINCAKLTKAVLSSGLKEISSSLFKYDDQLKEVVIPEGIQSVNSDAFRECNGLTEVTLPDSITYMDGYVFRNCENLTSVKLPKNLESIGSETFYGCKKLEEVVWPETIKTIGENAFAFCSLSGLKLPETLEKIGSYAFLETSVKEVTIPDGITEIGTSAFQECDKLIQVKTGKGLSTIGGYAFSNCHNLERVYIAPGTVEIGSSAFYWCEKVNKIYLPSSVKTIRDFAFSGGREKVSCNVYYAGSETDKEAITIETANQLLTTDGWTHWYYDQTEISSGDNIWDYSVNEDGVTCTLHGFGEKVSAESYENLVIDKIDGYIVSDISSYAFANNTEIKHVTFSENVRRVESWAFVNCKNLQSVTILGVDTQFINYPFGLNAQSAPSLKDVYYAGSLQNRKDYFPNNGSILNEAKWHYGVESEKPFEYEYTVNEDGKTCTITGTDNWIYGTVTIPNEIDGYTVTEIGKSAFYGKKNLQKVILPSELKTIAANAFYDCKNLEEIVFPNEIKEINAYAFGYCVNLKKAIIPDSVDVIGEGTFFYCPSMEEVKLPKDLKQLPKNMLYGCSKISKITFPESLEEVCEDAVEGNYDTLVIPGTVKILGSGSFSNANKSRVKISEGVTEINENAIGYADVISLPRSVSKIDANAIKGVKYIYYAGTASDREKIEIDASDSTLANATWVYGETEIPDYNFVMNADGKTCTLMSSNIGFSTVVSLPDEINGHVVTKIADGFGYYNDDIHTVIFPAHVESIGSGAFNMCLNLVSIQIPDTLKSIGRGAFDISSLGIIYYKGSVEDKQKIDLIYHQDIYDHVNASLWIYNFNNTPSEEKNPCGENTTWKVDNGILQISGTGSIQDSDSAKEQPWSKESSEITSVVVADGVTSIGDFSFYGMPNLESVTLPDSVTDIGDYAFKNCQNLKEINLPDGLERIGESAFYGNKSLTDIEMPDSVRSVGSYAFKGCTGLVKIKISMNLSKISESMLYGCSNLKEVTIPEGITKLDAYAFKNCTALITVSLPSTLTALGESAFYGCENLSDIDIPDAITVIGSYTFKNCKNLTDISLPESLKSIGESAFYGCISVKEIEVPDETTTIGSYAFKNCTALIRIHLPANLTKIQESAFYGCISLVSLAIPAWVSSIDSYAFRKCESLSTVTFPEGLQVIGESSFYGCEKLTSLTIPESVTTIGAYAFKTCKNVETLSLPSTLETIGDSAFYGCGKISSLTIPEAVEKIGDYAFAHATGLKDIAFAGNAPVMYAYSFSKVTAAVSYPTDNATWTQDKLNNYGGTLTWKK